MKQSGLCSFARLASSLSLFCILLCMHMNFTLILFLPSESSGIMDAVYIFFFAGAALGAFLCPLFLPLPGLKNKPKAISVCFIAVLIAVEFIFRSLGLRVWVGSSAVRIIMAVPEGIITTMCYGLFYLTWLKKPLSTQEQNQVEASAHENRTDKFCSLVLGAVLLGAVLARYYSVPLMTAGADKDAFENAVFVFDLIKWSMLTLGVSAVLTVILTHNARAVSAPADGDLSAATAAATVPETKTNLAMILRLISLASVFTILNGVLNMRMLPLYSSEAVYHPHYLTAAAAVLVLGFLAGRSISRFIRWFTPPVVVLFILVSCLPLFEEYPRFNMIMSTLVVIAHYTVWVVFTTAVVEYYGGSFWFYGIATVIFFSVVFAFLAPVIAPFVPNAAEYRVLFIVIAAVLFMLLSFRFIFPKQTQGRQEPFPGASALEDIFKERGLSQREIEVANLLVMEGFGKKEIGERLYISAGTAKLHISRIYQKFEVKTRAEFMALFVKKEL
jgi:DNA-binding CsgD family transcriptional regulator